jgi:hypothetical protein
MITGIFKMSQPKVQLVTRHQDSPETSQPPVELGCYVSAREGKYSLVFLGEMMNA